MSDTNNQEDQVSTDEVLEFLQSSGKLELSPEDAKALVGAPESEKEAEPVRSSTHEEFSKTAPSERFVHDWAMRAPDMGEVTVNELEKDLFLKAVLNDAPVIMDIMVPAIKRTVTLKTLTSLELDVLYGALEADRQDLKFAHESQFISDLQEYSLFLQGLKIASTPYAYAFTVIPEKTLADNIKDIRAHKDNAAKTMGQAQRAAVLQALRIFSLKNTICTDNLFNENFWNPPDAG